MPRLLHPRHPLYVVPWGEGRYMIFVWPLLALLLRALGLGPAGWWAIASDPRVLGDYKLYPLPEPTGLAAMETKEVQFLNARGMRFKKHYSYYVGEDDEEDGHDRGPGHGTERR